MKVIIYLKFSSNKELGPHRTIYGAPDNRLALHFLTEEDEGLYECILADGTASQINLKLTSKKTGVNGTYTVYNYNRVNSLIFNFLYFY
jgi:hypothetical protein